ncbi:hypothetical protein TrCOL_g10165 [Triparma columacea]|uniref:Uncharacterized protein n=1 Tax=Triparma columacea TaxID=722753 RepID=A0A9W7L936_9STRA|nr:hypothetical protein TrCOL_g10165 [Triparma columacea]
MAQGISWELRPSNTVAQLKHAPFLAAMKQEASGSATGFDEAGTDMGQRSLSSPPSCLVDAGCDVSIMNSDSDSITDFSAACSDIEQLLDCLHDSSSCGDYTIDSVDQDLLVLEDCYCYFSGEGCMPQCLLDSGCGAAVSTDTFPDSAACTATETQIECVESSSCDTDTKDNMLEGLGMRMDLCDCVLDSSCDFSIMSNPHSSATCNDVNTLMDCIDTSMTSCDGGTTEFIQEHLEDFENCYCVS